jgi:hypothetical protein
LDYLSNSSCMSLQFLFCYIQLQTSGKSQLIYNVTAEQYSDVFSQFNAIHNCTHAHKWDTEKERYVKMKIPFYFFRHQSSSVFAHKTLNRPGLSFFQTICSGTIHRINQCCFTQKQKNAVEFKYSQVVSLIMAKKPLDIYLVNWNAG